MLICHMNRLNKKWVLVWLLILGGVFITVWDYLAYRKIETQNYGHGPGEAKVTWQLDRLYQDSENRFRLKYADNMRIVEDVSGQIAVEYDALDVQIRVKVLTGATGTLKDWEDKEIADLQANERMYGERSYENTERTNMTLVRFQRFEEEKTTMVSRYLAKKSETLFVLEFVTDLDKWQINEGNIKEMARSLVLL